MDPRKQVLDGGADCCQMENLICMVAAMRTVAAIIVET